MIYKIFREEEWRRLEREGETPGAPVDIADGFIHFSTAATLAETARLHFNGEGGLWLAAVEPAPLGAALKWEPSRGGVDFPHLYRPLLLSDIAWCRPLPLGPSGHRFPADLA